MTEIPGIRRTTSEASLSCIFDISCAETPLCTTSLFCCWRICAASLSRRTTAVTVTSCNAAVSLAAVSGTSILGAPCSFVVPLWKLSSLVGAKATAPTDDRTVIATRATFFRSVEKIFIQRLFPCPEAPSAFLLPKSISYFLA